MIFSAGSYKPNLFENKEYGCVSLIDLSRGEERTLFKHTEKNYQDISVDPYGVHFVASNSNCELKIGFTGFLVFEYRIQRMIFRETRKSPLIKIC